MRHREPLRPLPPIKQMHRVQEPKHALQPEYRSGYLPMVVATDPMSPLQGRLAGTNPARVASADHSPASGYVGGLERVRLEPDFLSRRWLLPGPSIQAPSGTWLVLC